VIDEQTAATVREIMEQVVLVGTGVPAQPFGYTAAGKTGTAQKIDPATGRYSKTNYNASFIGYAPVNNPVVTILVNLDSPVGGHEGGPTAGPVFKEVAEQVLSYMNVPHDMPELPNLEKASLRQRTRQPSFDTQFDANFAKKAKRAARSMPLPAADIATVPESSTVAIAEGQTVTVPKLIGRSVRGVTEACSHLGLQPILVGDGIALDQSPDAGTKVLPGTKVMVHFGRSSDAATGAAGGSN
jgi:cell division protein FtsI (penicillin-binding protein 3)